MRLGRPALLALLARLLAGDTGLSISVHDRGGLLEVHRANATGLELMRRAPARPARRRRARASVQGWRPYRPAGTNDVYGSGRARRRSAADTDGWFSWGAAARRSRSSTPAASAAAPAAGLALDGLFGRTKVAVDGAKVVVTLPGTGARGAGGDVQAGDRGRGGAALTG